MRANEVDSYTHPFDDERVLYSVPDVDEEPANPLKRVGQRFWKRLGIQFVGHAKPEIEEDDDSEFDVRISFVPDDVLATYTEPELPEVRLAMLGKSAWRRSQHKRLWVSLVLLLLTLLLVGIALFGHTSPFSQTPSQTKRTISFTLNDISPIVHKDEANYVTAGPTHTIITAAPVPQYCPTGTMLGQGRQIGNFPVWLSGIDSATDVVHLSTQTLKSIRGWKGWIVHLQLSGRYKSLDIINLTALNIYGSTPPLLHNPYTVIDSSRIFINAKHPMRLLGASNAPNIGVWDIALYLPTAGCYALSASWGPGHWLINFAAGR